MPVSSDYQLVLAAKRNPKHFDALYNKYFKQIYIYIHNKIRNDQISGDLCQRIFMKAMVNIPKYKDMGYPFSSWLYKIASNEINKHFNDKKKITTVEVSERDVITFIDDIGESDNTEIRKKLITAMNILSEKNADAMTIIDLRYFEKKSFKEIGAELNITDLNAKIRTYRAIDKLKKVFNSINEDEKV